MNHTTNSAQLPILRAPRLHLRLLQQSDAEDIFPIYAHPQAMRYWSFPPYTELSQARALIDDTHRFCLQRSLFQWGVVLGDVAAAGPVVGTCTLTRLDWSNRRCEIGFILHPDHWRRGLITEAAQRMLAHAFDDLQMRRVEADADPRNAGSVAALCKLGFQYEGLLRERWLVNGEVQDAAFYGLLAREWSAPSWYAKGDS